MKRLPFKNDQIRALAQILRGIDFFSDLTVSDLDQVLDVTQYYEFKAGETIFKKGDKGDAFYLVSEGEVEVQLKSFFLFPSKSVDILGKGKFFGEMALLDGRSRSATVKTIQKSKIFVLLREDFVRILRHNPCFSNALNRIANRRRFETKRLAS